MAPGNLVPRLLSFPSLRSERKRENFSRGENLGMRLGTLEKELTGYNYL